MMRKNYFAIKWLILCDGCDGLIIARSNYIWLNNQHSLYNSLIISYPLLQWLVQSERSKSLWACSAQPTGSRCSHSWTEFILNHGDNNQPEGLDPYPVWQVGSGQIYNAGLVIANRTLSPGDSSGRTGDRSQARDHSKAAQPSMMKCI